MASKDIVWDDANVQWDDATPKGLQKPVPEQPQGNFILNAVRGLGGQIINNVGNALPGRDLNPQFADTAWRSKDLPGSGIGNILGGIATFAPAARLVTVPARLIGSALTGAATQEGDMGDRLKAAAWALLGQGVGEGAAKVINSVANPFKKVLTPIEEQHIAAAKAMDIPLDASEVTGNSALKTAASVLDTLPASSTQQAEFKQAQSNAWHKAAFAKAGHTYEPTLDNMNLLKGRLSDAYDHLSATNELEVDKAFKTELHGIGTEYSKRLPTNQLPVVKSYLNDYKSMPIGLRITGADYQDTRSMLGKQAKGLEISDPMTARVLNEIKSTLDFHMFKNLTPMDKVTWIKTNADYAAMKTLAKAYDPTLKTISPMKLASVVNRADPDHHTGLAEVADVGRQFIAENVPNSGTAQRTMMTNLLTGRAATGGMGALLGGLNSPDDRWTGTVLGGIGGASLSHMLPKVASNLILKQPASKWLTEGFYGANKQDMVKQLLGTLGASTASQ